MNVGSSVFIDNGCDTNTCALVNERYCGCHITRAGCLNSSFSELMAKKLPMDKKCRYLGNYNQYVVTFTIGSS